MTRTQYYTRRSYWRKAVRGWRLRRNKEIPTRTISNLAQILRDLYDFYLEPHDKVKLDLIRKYESKVSERLKIDALQLEEKGRSKENKNKLTNYMRDLVYHENPFLKMAPKIDGYAGTYISVPITNDDE